MRDYVYKDDPESLQKYRKEALKFTNSIRQELGQPPLEDLKAGSMSASDACVVTKSIEAPGLYPSTGYESVHVFDHDIIDPDVGEPNYCGISGHSSELKKAGRLEYVDVQADAFSHGIEDHVKAWKTFKVTANVQRFLKAFDDGLYEDLVVTLPVFEEV